MDDSRQVSVLCYGDAVAPERDALVVSTVDGRPIKIEGNPLHPYSNGGTDAFAQASLLDLYDPNRSKRIKNNDAEVGADLLESFLKKHCRRRRPGTAFLVERKNSPTRDRLRNRARIQVSGDDLV